MVMHLIDGMTASGGVKLVVAKNHIIDYLLSDYEAAVTYMSKKSQPHFLLRQEVIIVVTLHMRMVKTKRVDSNTVI